MSERERRLARWQGVRDAMSYLEVALNGGMTWERAHAELTQTAAGEVARLLTPDPAFERLMARYRELQRAYVAHEFDPGDPQAEEVKRLIVELGRSYPQDPEMFSR